jgi:hypothetical protein
MSCNLKLRKKQKRIEITGKYKFNNEYRITKFEKQKLVTFFQTNLLTNFFKHYNVNEHYKFK